MKWIHRNKPRSIAAATIMTFVLMVALLSSSCSLTHKHVLYRYAVDRRIDHNSVLVTVEQIVYRPGFHVKKRLRTSSGIEISEDSGTPAIQVSLTIENLTDEWLEICTHDIQGSRVPIYLLVDAGRRNFVGFSSYGEIPFKEEIRQDQVVLLIPPNSQVSSRLMFDGTLPQRAKAVDLVIEQVAFADERQTWDYHFEGVKLGKPQVEPFDPFHDPLTTYPDSR